MTWGADIIYLIWRISQLFRRIEYLISSDNIIALV